MRIVALKTHTTRLAMIPFRISWRLTFFGWFVVFILALPPVISTFILFSVWRISVTQMVVTMLLWFLPLIPFLIPYFDVERRQAGGTLAPNDKKVVLLVGGVGFVLCFVGFQPETAENPFLFDSKAVHITARIAGVAMLGWAVFKSVWKSRLTRRQQEEAQEDNAYLMQHAGKPSGAILCYALAMLVAFFMPWVRMGPIGIAGYEAGRISWWGSMLWIIPILAGMTVAVSLQNKDNRKIGVAAGIAPMSLWGCLFVYTRMQLGKDFDTSAFVWRTISEVGPIVTLLTAFGLVSAAYSAPRGINRWLDQLVDRIRQAPQPPSSNEPNPPEARPSVDKFTQLERLGDLRDRGLITDAEFDEQKRRILN